MLIYVNVKEGVKKERRKNKKKRRNSDTLRKRRQKRKKMMLNAQSETLNPKACSFNVPNYTQFSTPFFTLYIVNTRLN